MVYPARETVMLRRLAKARSLPRSMASRKNPEPMFMSRVKRSARNMDPPFLSWSVHAQERSASNSKQALSKQVSHGQCAGKQRDLRENARGQKGRCQLGNSVGEIAIHRWVASLSKRGRVTHRMIRIRPMEFPN